MVRSSNSAVQGSEQEDDDEKRTCGTQDVIVQTDEDVERSKCTEHSNTAGAKRGTGYCDTQCIRDIKWTHGRANVKDWVPSETDVVKNQVHELLALAESSAKVAELTVEVESLTGLRAHYEERCSGLTRDLASRDGELAEAAEYLRQLNVELQELRQQLSETLDDASGQRDRADTAEEEAEELRQRLVELESASTAQRKTAVWLEAELVESRSIVERLLDREDAIVQQLIKTRLEAEESAKDQEQEVFALQARLAEAQTQMEELATEMHWSRAMARELEMMQARAEALAAEKALMSGASSSLQIQVTDKAQCQAVIETPQDFKEPRVDFPIFGPITPGGQAEGGELTDESAGAEKKDWCNAEGQRTK